MTKPYTGVPGFNVENDDAPTPSTTNTRVTKPDTAVVTLRGVRVPLNSDVGAAFIADCSRNKERIFSDDRIREKYDISETDWTEITQSKAVRLAVNAEHERRMLNGTAAQESAAKIFTEAPEVLGSILRDNKASPRHRVDAAKELRATAHAGDEKSGPDTDRVIVTINLGNAPEDKLVFDCGPPKQTRESPDAETDQW